MGHIIEFKSLELKDRILLVSFNSDGRVSKVACRVNKAFLVPGFGKGQFLRWLAVF